MTVKPVMVFVGIMTMTTVLVMFTGDLRLLWLLALLFFVTD